MQNDMLITKIRLKLKAEIEFQYGGRPFSETGSRFISDGAWDISPKRGMQIDFHLLKWVLSPDMNLEVDFQLYGRHLEQSIWRHISATVRPITTKFGKQMENGMPVTTHGSIWKP